MSGSGLDVRRPVLGWTILTTTFLLPVAFVFFHLGEGCDGMVKITIVATMV